MLYERVVEVDERVRADGVVERAPDLDALRLELQRARDDGIGAVAIVLMHAYRYSEHERRIAALARELGFPQVSASHDVSALIKLVGRGDTTVADAYLSPILRRYVAQVAGSLLLHPLQGRVDARASGASVGSAAVSGVNGAAASPPPAGSRGDLPPPGGGEETRSCS